MAAFVKFNSFVEALAEKKHNLGSDVLAVFLTNTAPSAANSVLADITQISYTNCSPRVLTVTSSSQTGGTYKLVVEPLTLTAVGGSVGPFRYVGIYNDTATNDELICYYDYGAEITMSENSVFECPFDAEDGALTLV